MVPEELKQQPSLPENVRFEVRPLGKREVYLCEVIVQNFDDALRTLDTMDDMDSLDNAIVPTYMHPHEKPHRVLLMQLDKEIMPEEVYCLLRLLFDDVDNADEDDMPAWADSED